MKPCKMQGYSPLREPILHTGRTCVWFLNVIWCISETKLKTTRVTDWISQAQVSESLASMGHFTQ